ncbi:hypothetical protein BK816_03445 [Boudabousia tangfeifanii]|uniref:DUF7847 domain-containing protein n=1 Tax=Boudabousia tangfeifanii TaxID=1912795 RepID=A0A1D9MJJ2_9ACTO|nr:glycerophosphoryl diester phosphodiesterase membrane domain-containing protein [Boudabousia tangfeifanii]AOZ72464.1 hypothetical protein BK816_03445 [Boudabousia tangfeifanii]
MPATENDSQWSWDPYPQQPKSESSSSYNDYPNYEANNTNDGNQSSQNYAENPNQGYQGAAPNDPFANYQTTTNYYGHSGGRNFKPGIMPIRPLTLGDIIESVFAALRANPGILFGVSLIVMTFIALLNVLVFWLLPFGNDLGLIMQNPDNFFESNDAETIGNSIASIIVKLAGTTLFSGITQQLAIIILSGLSSYTVARAIIGKKPTWQKSWEETKGRIPALILYTLLQLVVEILVMIIPIGLLVGLVGYIIYTASDSDPSSFGSGAAISMVFGVLLLFLLAIIPLIFVTIRLSVGSVVIVLEKSGPVEAMKRSWQLTKGRFFPIFGYTFVFSLIIGIIVGVLSQILTLPLMLGLASDPQLTFNFSQLIGTISSALTIPVMAAFYTLIYHDLRIRKEAFAQTLIDIS